MLTPDKATFETWDQLKERSGLTPEIEADIDGQLSAPWEWDECEREVEFEVVVGVPPTANGTPEEQMAAMQGLAQEAAELIQMVYEGVGWVTRCLAVVEGAFSASDGVFPVCLGFDRPDEMGPND